MVTGIARLAGAVLQVASLVLLARLVAPDAFGLVALAASLLAFFDLLRVRGLSASAGEHAAITQAQLSTLFWINTAHSLLLFGVVCVLAPAVAHVFGRADLAPVVVWLGLGIVTGGLGAQHVALLQREMRFAALAAAEIGAAIAGIVVAVAVAMNDGGVWALVAQRLTWSAALTALAWTMCGWRPGRPARDARLPGKARHGGNFAFSNALQLCARNLDRILIGWWWGVAPLGLYATSHRLLAAPVRTLDGSLLTASVPLLDRVANRPRLYRRTFLRMFGGVCMASVPLAALLIAAPDWVVAVMLGPEWAGAAGIVMWFGVAVLYLPASGAATWLFVTQDRVGELARWRNLSAALRIASMAAGLSFGAAGVAAGFALSGMFVGLPLLLFRAGGRGPVSRRDLCAALGPSAAVGGLAVASVFGARFVPGLMPADPVAALGTALFIAVATALAGFAAIPRSRRLIQGALALRSMLFGSEVQP